MRLGQRTNHQLGLLATTLFAASLALGCQQLEQLDDTTNAGIVRQAGSLYDYGRERPPAAIKDSAFPGPVVEDPPGAPNMSIATATLKEGVTQPPHRILARIHSSGDYAPMGIRAGDNYIWRSSWDSTKAASWVTSIVPGDSAATRHTLQRDARLTEYTHGDAAEPRLVRITVHSLAIGVCLSDPVCTSGHCGYW
jgi:hypothetical protein